MLFSVVLLFCAILFTNAQDFEVPDAIVEVFSPKGFRVSIPDQEGIKLFAFHGKINQKLDGREAGTFSVDITKSTNGYWSYYNSQAKLKVGDILYFWTYVMYGEEKLGFPRDDQEFQVTQLVPFTKEVKGIALPINTTTAPPVTCRTFSKTTINGGQGVCSGQLIFEDNFENFDSTKWKKEVKIPGSPDYQFVIYMNSPDNVDVKSGNLHLKPTLAVNKFGESFIDDSINLGRNCTGIPGTTECDKKAESFQILPPVISGRVKSKDIFSFLYGKVEIRAKLPQGKWIYPELFLQPKGNEYGLDYDSGQMRIAFSAGNPALSKNLQGGVILGTSPEARTYGIEHYNTTQNWSDNYHIYSLTWTPENINVRVDDAIYGIITPPAMGYVSLASTLKTGAGQRWAEGELNAPFDKEMYLILGVGVGGHNFPDGVDNKPWKNKSPKNTLQFWTNKNMWYNTWNEQSALLIDYVKVWAL